MWSAINDERHVGHLLHRTRGALADAIAGNVSEHEGVVMKNVSQNASGPELCSHRNDLRRVLFWEHVHDRATRQKRGGNSSMPTALVLRRLLPNVAQVAAPWKQFPQTSYSHPAVHLQRVHVSGNFVLVVATIEQPHKKEGSVRRSRSAASSTWSLHRRSDPAE